MADITLSKAVRSNLLSLQSTAAQMGKTQERLATGLKVNSALDNPTNFFTASSLNSRASDLSQLLDSVSNAVQTIAAADKGLTAITKLVETAQATARQALQTAATISQSSTSVSAQATVTGDVAIADDVAATSSGSTDISGLLTGAGLSNGQSLSITIGSTTKVIAFNNTGTAGVGEDEAVDLNGANDAVDTTDDATGADLVSAINTAFGSTVASLGSGNELVLTAGNTTDSISVAAGAAKTALGGLADADATNATIGALSGTLTIAGNTLTFGAGNIETRADLESALSGLTGGVTGSINGSDFLTFTGSSGDAFTVGGTLDVDAAFGVAEDEYEATTTTTETDVANPKREELRAQYNELLSQIDQLANDSGFNGVNLLDGDSLEVLFNEDGSSKLSVTGVTYNAAGIGLSSVAANGFDDNSDINDTLDSLKSAIDDLRTQSSKFGANLSVVETRQDFTKNMINVLETGAANLTLADTNEEAANLLALQTRQQLSSTALSLASQSDQNVLRLF